MKHKKENFWRYLRDYFTIYLPKQKNNSPHTITACSQTWNLLLRFLSIKKNIALEKLHMVDIDSKKVLEFLDYMEKEKGWKPSTRNQRLSCIRSFFKYIACIEPSFYIYSVDLGTIPLKKGINNSHVIEFMTQDAMKVLLAIPNSKTRLGMRDQFFMSLMYDTAARDCEMLGMKISDFNVQALTIYLIGKGAKPRLVPVSKETVKLFEEYRKKFHSDSTGSEPMFYTIHKGKKTFMSDDNVARFMKKYAENVRKSGVEIPENVHPHMFRRSRSMHLYRSGMPLALLAEFLGHENPETTLIYSFADTEMKRVAIEKASEKNVILKGNGESAIWEGDDDIIGRLCKGY